MGKKKIMGFEIGNYTMKIALCIDDVIQKYVDAKMPEGMVIDDEIVSWEAMADFIKESVSGNDFACRYATVALPTKLAYITRITMPLMTIDQLKVNLPFEFHDYITEDMDKFVYDYSVISIDEDDKKMEILAVAAEKEIIEKYKTMFRRAGIRLKAVVPEVLAYRNIIKDYEALNNNSEDQDYAILDIGHKSVKLHFFTGGEYEITRTMEPGCDAIVQAVAEAQAIDIHIAQMNIEANPEGISNIDALKNMYNQQAVEVMRVMNFYGFNHPVSNLNKIYYCGAGVNFKSLISEIESVSGYELRSIAELIGESTPLIDKVVLGPQALGIVWE